MQTRAQSIDSSNARLTYDYGRFRKAMAFARKTIADIPENTSVDELVQSYQRATYRLHRIALSVQIAEAVTAADASIKKFVEDQIAVVESYGLLPVTA
ncbi:hypothetical protein [Nitrobacter sp. TKz-YC02]|uniref:hypothetical protein n=1 Tax=Nitrobacter sp. TKz-YC02 TaxID=3398704 RepID=UPI003CED3736